MACYRISLYPNMSQLYDVHVAVFVGGQSTLRYELGQGDTVGVALHKIGEPAPEALADGSSQAARPDVRLIVGEQCIIQSVDDLRELYAVRAPCKGIPAARALVRPEGACLLQAQEYLLQVLAGYVLSACDIRGGDDRAVAGVHSYVRQRHYTVLYLCGYSHRLPPLFK